MASLWPHRAYTFRALSRIYGQMWLRCDVCRRYARLRLAGLHDVDSRTRTYSCSQCGAEAYFSVIEPFKENGMEDYRLDEVGEPAHHPKAVERLTGRRRSNRRVDYSGGQLPGRTGDGRR